MCINNLDDDCNGQTDENCVCQPNYVDNMCATTSGGTPITYPGGAPKGACSYGSRTCASDGRSWNVCTGAVGPASTDNCTVAGGIDADCDGVISCACSPTGAQQSCANQNGACAGSKQSCTDTGWGACTVAPAAQDTCDAGNDASCDGVANNGFPGSTAICQCLNGTSQSCGNCSAGTQTCSAGHWGSCNGAPGNIGQPCNVAGKNVGACASGGTWQCDVDAPSTPKCVAVNSHINTNYSSGSPAPNGSFDWSCDGSYSVTVLNGLLPVPACPMIWPNPSGDCSGWIGSYQDQVCGYIGDSVTCNAASWAHTCGTVAQNCSNSSTVCNVGWSVWRCQWANNACHVQSNSYTFSTSTCG